MKEAVKEKLIEVYSQGELITEIDSKHRLVKHQRYMLDGDLHRIDGPALITEAYSSYYFQGKEFPNAQSYYDYLDFLYDEIKYN